MQTSSYVDTCNTLWNDIDGQLLSIRPRTKQECCCEKIETIEVCPCELNNMGIHNIMNSIKCTGITNSDIDKLVDSLPVEDNAINYGCDNVIEKIDDVISDIELEENIVSDDILDVIEETETKNKPVKQVKRKVTRVNRNKKSKNVVK